MLQAVAGRCSVEAGATYATCGKEGMTTERDTIRKQLVELGLCDASSIRPFYPRVRDRDDIAVLRCTRSGVLFLSGSDHVDVSRYRQREDFGYWSVRDRQQAVNLCREDTARRKKILQHMVVNRRWLDVGTGSGGILDAVSSLAATVIAVEPQKAARESLERAGYRVYPDIESVEEDEFDVVTLFHVFEHLADPLGTLKLIRAKLAGNGKILIEVPHARDMLISFFDLDGFKRFTFWSEHLLLHTRQSLYRFLEVAGFSEIMIEGCQRYPLANHLHWLAQNRPGGHEKWRFLRTPELDDAYAGMLARLDRTDTLIATAARG